MFCHPELVEGLLLHHAKTGGLLLVMLNAPTLPELVQHAAVAIEVVEKEDETGAVRREVRARLAYPTTLPDYVMGSDGRFVQKENEPVAELKHRLNGDPNREIIWYSQWMRANQARVLFEELQMHTQYNQNQHNAALINHAAHKAQEVRHANV